MWMTSLWRVDIVALAESILREIDTSDLKKFPDDYIEGKSVERLKFRKASQKLGRIYTDSS